MEKHLVLPLAEEGIHAGFPSPAQDYMELSITYSGAYPFTFRQPIKHKIAFKSTILYPFIP